VFNPDTDLVMQNLDDVRLWLSAQCQVAHGCTISRREHSRARRHIENVELPSITSMILWVILPLRIKSEKIEKRTYDLRDACEAQNRCIHAVNESLGYSVC
jgi:hypothetical protein